MTIPNQGFIISSHVCVPPYTSTVGSGFPRLAAELSKCASTRSFVPLGKLERSQRRRSRSANRSRSSARFSAISDPSVGIRQAIGHVLSARVHVRHHPDQLGVHIERRSPRADSPNWTSPAGIRKIFGSVMHSRLPGQRQETSRRLLLCRRESDPRDLGDRLTDRLVMHVDHEIAVRPGSASPRHAPGSPAAGTPGT